MPTSKAPPTNDLRQAKPEGGAVARRATATLRTAVAVGALLGTGWGCDGTPRSLDASIAPSARMSTLSLRIDVAPEKQPTLTVLGFHAAFSGISASDVMTLVDPLADAGPGRDCQMRDIDDAAATLAAGGNAIELEEFGSAGIAVDEGAPALRLSPRLFPDVAPAIGGVVSEAGPFALSTWPEKLRVSGEATVDGPAQVLSIPVPSAGQITAINGATPAPSGAIAIAGDLNLALVAGGAGDSAVEVRPLGTTVALICRVPADATHASAISFVVSHQLIANLVAATGATPGRPVAASLDLVRRISGNYASNDSRIAVEVRASTLVELHP
ncbi:MAG TPA: hypothetical protein VGP07_02480 [Polyangia bacterium]|jgi:hypothetical protein